MYLISEFDRNTGDMSFKVQNDNDVFIVNINVMPGKTPSFADYRAVPERAYVRQDTGDIEIVGTMFGMTNPCRPIPPPSIYQEIDGKEVQYIIASQYDFDKWSDKTTPDCDNATVFRLLDGLTKEKANEFCNN